MLSGDEKQVRNKMGQLPGENLQGWDKGESEIRWMAEASGDVTFAHLDEVRVPAI